MRCADIPHDRLPNSTRKNPTIRNQPRKTEQTSKGTSTSKIQDGTRKLIAHAHIHSLAISSRLTTSPTIIPKTHWLHKPPCAKAFSVLSDPSLRASNPIEFDLWAKMWTTQTHDNLHPVLTMQTHMRSWSAREFDIINNQFQHPPAHWTHDDFTSFAHKMGTSAHACFLRSVSSSGRKGRQSSCSVHLPDSPLKASSPLQLDFLA